MLHVYDAHVSYKFLFEICIAITIAFAHPVLHLNDAQKWSTHLFYSCSL